jgi:FdhE protein
LHNIELEHLAFFANYLVRPIRGAVAAITTEQGLATGWQYGYCPVCGLWARMGHIDSHEGGRTLWCLGCGFSWQFPRLSCPFCLERRPEQLGFLRVDETDRFRVYTCDSCRRYLKTVVAPQNETVAFDVEYLSSSAYDVTASFEKYIQDFVGFAAFDMKENAASKAYRQRALS